jgi:hypothetical protein
MLPYYTTPKNFCQRFLGIFSGIFRIFIDLL